MSLRQAYVLYEIIRTYTLCKGTCTGYFNDHMQIYVFTHEHTSRNFAFTIPVDSYLMQVMFGTRSWL
jgi:hypothetical protein